MKKQGWATAANEVLFGMNALAAPVFDHRGHYAGAIAIVGSTQFIEAKPAAKQVKLVAFDASEALVDDLRQGHIDALVVQSPFVMGYESTHAICRKLAGETPAAQFDSGATLVTAPDLAKPDIQALLFPKIQQYLTGSPGH